MTKTWDSDFPTRLVSVTKSLYVSVRIALLWVANADQYRA